MGFILSGLGVCVWKSTFMHGILELYNYLLCCRGARRYRICYNGFVKSCLKILTSIFLTIPNLKKILFGKKSFCLFCVSLVILQRDNTKSHVAKGYYTRL